MMIGIGVIVRDSEGEVLATLSALKAHIIAPDIAEAMVTLQVTCFCIEFGFYKVVLEGDTF